jgi:branched-chain amino acid transport system permease protein
MKRVRILGLLALLMFALVFPLIFPNPAVTSMAVFTLLFVCAATGWNLFSGYTGYISLGYGTFYGIGAYALALLCKIWNIEGGYGPFLLVPLTGLIAIAFAFPIGWLALRTRRQAFVIITIASLYIFQLLAYNLRTFTNGSAGLLLPTPAWSGDFYNQPFYYVSLVLALLAIALSRWIRHSKYGLGLLAIRDDEDRALGLGVKTSAYKLSAFVIAAFLAAMVGSVTMYFLGTVYPAVAFDPTFDLLPAMMAFIGGVGTLAGPIFGALLLEPLQQFLILQFGQSGVDLLLFGVIMLAILFFLPQGILPALRQLWIKWRANRISAESIVGSEGKKEALLLEGGTGEKG